MLKGDENHPFFMGDVPAGHKACGLPGQVTQIHLQGIVELGLQLSQGLLAAAKWWTGAPLGSEVSTDIMKT